ncbi:hypothetical protein AA16663_1022 [Komagataeibacter rhaeticus DSM 16663]|nr:hypothetical protein AA16663_1022 [Komagataeibacter rhaeticus DSM 16663]
MAQQFLTGILADLAELVIDIGNDAPAVGYGHDQYVINHVRPEVGIFMRKGAKPVIMLGGHSVTSKTDRKTGAGLTIN